MRRKGEEFRPALRADVVESRRRAHQPQLVVDRYVRDVGAAAARVLPRAVERIVIVRREDVRAVRREWETLNDELDGAGGVRGEANRVFGIIGIEMREQEGARLVERRRAPPRRSAVGVWISKDAATKYVLLRPELPRRGQRASGVVEIGETDLVQPRELSVA